MTAGTEAAPHVPGGAVVSAAMSGSGPMKSAESEADPEVPETAESIHDAQKTVELSDTLIHGRSRTQGPAHEEQKSTEDAPQFLTSAELVGDETPDFEPLVESPDALSGESKLLLDDAGPDLGHEGAAEHFREDDPFQVEDPGIVTAPGGEVDWFSIGRPDSKGGLLEGLDLTGADPRLAAGWRGSVVGAYLSAAGLADQLGDDDLLSPEVLKGLAHFVAGGIEGMDPASIAKRQQVYWDLGVPEAQPAEDTDAADKLADLVPADSDPADSDPLAELGVDVDSGEEDAYPPTGPSITPHPDDPGGDTFPVDPKRAPPGFSGSSTDLPPAPEDPFEQKPDPFDTLIQPPDGGEDAPPPEAIAARLEASLEARQSPFTDPHPEEGGDDEWEDPFRELPGGLGMPGVDEADSLIDPPETLEGGVFGTEGPPGPDAVEGEDGIDDEALEDLGP